jgi:hypothetical protein
MAKPSRPPAERGAQALTSLIKLAGFVMAVNEALVETARDPYVLAVAAFMMAGAQGIDELIKAWRRP